ncbi:MAG: DinB family protein [Chitinophagales bacterium]|nr:DinB family protein [Chitinophagales bacterium]
MVFYTLLKEYTRYNLWANTRLVNWLAQATEAQLEQPLESSFPSIRATVQHLWGAEAIWLERLRGNSPTTFVSLQFQGSSQEVLQHWIKASADFTSFVVVQEDAFFQQTFEYKNLAGEAFRSAAQEMIQHCMNHSTYHRGQLITLGRQVGLGKAPQSDYIAYVRERDGA